MCTKKVHSFLLFVYQTGTLCMVIIPNIPSFVKGKIELLFFVYFWGYRLTLKVHMFTPKDTQVTPLLYTTFPQKIHKLHPFRTQRSPKNASTTGFFGLPNIKQI